jgi:hypothetical protein
MAIPRFGRLHVPPLATKLAVVGIQFAILFAFAVAGTVFLGLTMASPVVVPLAGRQGVMLSPADLATAQAVGSAWWLFAAGTVLSFGAALATLGNLMQRMAGSAGE